MAKKLSSKEELSFKILKYRLRKTKDPSKIAKQSRALDKKIRKEAKARKKSSKETFENLDRDLEGSFINNRKKL